MRKVLSALTVALLLVAPTAAQPRTKAALYTGPWNAFVCADGGFQIYLPSRARPAFAKRGDNQTAVLYYFSTSPAANRDFCFGYLEYIKADATLKGMPYRFLSRFPTGFANKLKGKLVFQRRRRFGPNPGLDYLVDNGSDRAMRGRVILVGQRVYFIHVEGPDRGSLALPDSWTFFESLRLDGKALVSQQGQGAPRLVPEMGYDDLIRMGIPRGTVEMKRNLDEQLRRIDVRTFLREDPTFYTRTREENLRLIVEDFERLQKELEDPKTPPKRKREILNEMKWQTDFARRCDSIWENISTSVLRSYNRMLETNRTFNRVREANAEKLEAEAAARSAEEAIWRAEDAIRDSRIHCPE